MSRQPRCKSFDFYSADFLNDQRVQVMTAEQRGAYICLILSAWESEVPGVLPAERAALARLALCTPEEWNRVESAVGSCFDRSDGRWIHRRIRRDHEAQSRRIAQTSKTKSRAGKKGNEVRWGKQDSRKCDPGVIAEASPLLPPHSIPPKISADAGSPSAIVHSRSLDERRDLSSMDSSAEIQAPAESRRVISGVVKELAKKLSMPPPKVDWRVRAWDDAQAIGRGTEQAKKLMELAGWARKRGAMDPLVHSRMFRHVVQHGIRNPMAYFTENGLALQAFLGQRAVERAEDEQKAIKRAEAEMGYGR